MAGTDAQQTWTTHQSNVALFETLSKPGPRRPALPTEIILQILAYPSRWVLASSATRDSPYINRETNAETPILETSPLCHPASLVRKIMFTFRSKDQGWSSFRDDHGYYRNSWTWFDAGLRRLSGSGLSNAGLPIMEVDTARHFLQCNRHAHDKFLSYRIEIDRDHQLVQGLVEGDKVVLWACQKFQGWANLVESAEIEVWALDELFAYG